MMMRARFTIGDINVILSAVIEGRLVKKVLNVFRLRLKKKAKTKKTCEYRFPTLESFYAWVGPLFFLVQCGISCSNVFFFPFCLFRHPFDYERLGSTKTVLFLGKF